MTDKDKKAHSQKVVILGEGQSTIEIKSKVVMDQLLFKAINKHKLLMV